MFGYAAALSLARANSADLVVDDVSGFQYDSLYRRTFQLHNFNISGRIASNAERREPFGRIRRYVLKASSKFSSLDMKSYVSHPTVVYSRDYEDFITNRQELYYEPIIQSENIFQNSKDQVFREYQLKPSVIHNLKHQIPLMKSGSVAVHFRWFDNSPVSHQNVGYEYYRQAFRVACEKISNPYFFIFSDNIPLVEQHYSGLLSEFPHEFMQARSSSMADFYAMQSAECIISSNSTYSWWAAWLGEYSGLTRWVIVPCKFIDPKQSVTAWGFENLLPKRWISIQ